MNPRTDFLLLWQHLIEQAQHERKLLDKVVAAEKRHSEQYLELISIRKALALRTKEKWLLEKDGNQPGEGSAKSESENMISEFREQILQLRRSEMDAEYLANESFMEWILTGIANSNARKTRLREEIDRALERANNCLSNVERARDQLGEEREARSRQQHEHHAEQLQTILHRLRQRQDS